MGQRLCSDTVWLWVCLDICPCLNAEAPESAAQAPGTLAGKAEDRTHLCKVSKGPAGSQIYVRTTATQVAFLSMAWRET